MPTGYTSNLYDGKDQTFAEFAMDCARNFGALILMRDEPIGAEIPDEFAPSSTYKDWLANARAELEVLIRLTDEQAQAEATREADEEEARRAEQEAKRQERKARYEAMLEQVQAWKPPTSEHVGMKEFMIEQLTSSIEFDCSTYDFPAPERDGAKWRQEKIARLRRDIERWAVEDAKEVERARGRTAWVRALRDSLAEHAEV